MFRLFPHKDRNAQIRGELIDYDLSDAGGRSHLYEALSYVWYDGEGSTDRDSQSIILNDCIFSVTPNLYAALLRLRNHQLERALWIDAVCINQSDDDEKQEQIPLMRTIYAQASRVIVWLGEARSNSDEALENIRRLAGDSVNDGPASDRYHNYTSATDGPSTAKSVMIDHDACEMLFKRNWFRRIWVQKPSKSSTHIIDKWKIGASGGWCRTIHLYYMWSCRDEWLYILERFQQIKSFV